MSRAKYSHTIQYFLSVLASVGVSYALFYFMQSVVLNNDIEQASTSLLPAQHIEFIRIKKKETLEIKERKVPEPPTPQPVPPSSYQTNPVEVSVSTGLSLPPMEFPRFTGSEMPSGVINIPLGSIAIDEEAMPVFRIPPIYPQRAAKRGIEGWVEIEFTITALGTVKNARVVTASPEGIFDNAALRAISRWKFKPKVLNKVAVERYHVRQRISFKLEGIR